MTWYAAHILIAIIVRDEPKGPITVWENVVLVDAPDAQSAVAKARALGQAQATVTDGVEIDGRPANYEFAGIRKLINVSNPPPLDLDQDRPVSGSEITYSEMVVADRAALKALAEGKSVQVQYRE